MSQSDKLLRVLTTPYSALISVIFGLMILAFPVGAYVVFNTQIGKELSYDYPLDGIDIFLGGIGLKIPLQFELGDGFTVIWCAYLTLFAISFSGPTTNFSKAVSSLMSEGWQNIKSNYLLSMLTWFSILIVVSFVIDLTQQSVGVSTEPPQFPNRLVQFFQLTSSPLTEELGFRVALIGLPLFAMFSHKSSIGHFFKSLWHPSKALQISSYKKVIVLVIMVAIFFGIAHVISGAPWTTGKVAQASIAGVIIGWIYVRYGLIPAILIHWATNYFVFSYIFFTSELNQIEISSSMSNPFMNTLEILFLLTGSLAIILQVINFLKTKNLLQH